MPRLPAVAHLGDLAIDALLIGFAWWLAFAFRFNFAVPEEFDRLIRQSMVWPLLLHLISLAVFGVRRHIWRYTSLAEIERLGYALAMGALLSATARPITLPDSCSIDIVMLPPQDARGHFDGQTRLDLRAGDCVRLKGTPRSLRLLHPQGYSYFAMLRQKLHWSAAPRL